MHLQCGRAAGEVGQRFSWLLSLSEQQAGVSRIDADQFVMFVPSSVESLTGAPSDVVLFVPDDGLERTNVARRDRADDPAFAVPNELFL